MCVIVFATAEYFTLNYLSNRFISLLFHFANQFKNCLFIFTCIHLRLLLQFLKENLFHRYLAHSLVLTSVDYFSVYQKVFHPIMITFFVDEFISFELAYFELIYEMKKELITFKKYRNIL